jgi:hypothetical protein
MRENLRDMIEAHLRTRQTQLKTILNDDFTGERLVAVLGWAANVLEDEANELESDDRHPEAVIALRDLAACFWSEFVNEAAAHGDVEIVADQALGLRVIKGGKS